MNRREARRLALLLIVDDVDRAVEIGEYDTHPENDHTFTVQERNKVVREVKTIVRTLYNCARELPRETKK